MSREAAAYWVPRFRGGRQRGCGACVAASKHDFAFSRRDLPEVCMTLSLERTEGAGNAGCTLHPRSRVQGCTKKSAHEHTGSAEAVRHSLRNGFTAYAVLSSATNSFCHRRQRIKTCPSPVGPTHLRWLGISNGCQDHTVLPYATSAVRPARREPLTSSTSPCDHLCAPTLPRPPHPIPRS